MYPIKIVGTRAEQVAPRESAGAVSAAGERTAGDGLSFRTGAEPRAFAYGDGPLATLYYLRNTFVSRFIYLFIWRVHPSCRVGIDPRPRIYVCLFCRFWFCFGFFFYFRDSSIIRWTVFRDWRLGWIIAYSKTKYYCSIAVIIETRT